MSGPCGWGGCDQGGRLWPAGWRCDEHTPAALANRSEPGRTASEYVPQSCPLPIPSGQRTRLIAIEVTTLQLPEPDYG